MSAVQLTRTIIATKLLEALDNDYGMRDEPRLVQGPGCTAFVTEITNAIFVRQAAAALITHDGNGIPISPNKDGERQSFMVEAAMQRGFEMIDDDGNVFVCNARDIVALMDPAYTGIGVKIEPLLTLKTHANDKEGMGHRGTLPVGFVKKLINEALEGGEPIPMVLHCPACGHQHIDKDNCDEIRIEAAELGLTHGSRDWEDWIEEREWTNPPHRSHACQLCKYIWRPADVATTGVAAIKTKGQKDHADRDTYRASDDYPLNHHRKPQTKWHTATPEPIAGELAILRPGGERFIITQDHGCQATRQSDEMYCARCDLRWDVTEDKPDCK